MYVAEEQQRTGAAEQDTSTKFDTSDLEVQWDYIHWPAFVDIDRLDSGWWAFANELMKNDPKSQSRKRGNERRSPHREHAVSTHRGGPRGFAAHSHPEVGQLRPRVH